MGNVSDIFCSQPGYNSLKGILASFLYGLFIPCLHNRACNKEIADEQITLSEGSYPRRVHLHRDLAKLLACATTVNLTATL